jgi:hypothetical protein
MSNLRFICAINPIQKLTSGKSARMNVHMNHSQLRCFKHLFNNNPVLCLRGMIEVKIIMYVYAKSYQIKKSLKRREKERTAMKCFDEEIMCLVILVVLVLMD